MPELINTESLRTHLHQQRLALSGTVGSPADGKKADLDAEMAVVEAALEALRTFRMRLVRLPALDCQNADVYFEEVLLRLYDRERKPMPIFDTLMLLQRWGLLGEITPYLINLQLDQHASGRPISLNVPPASLATQQQRTKLAEVLEAFARENGPGHGVILEITETAYVEPTPELTGFMHAMKALGYRWALDDFGDGFHTYEHLDALPLDFVKMSKELSHMLLHHTSLPPEVHMALEMCRKAGLQLIAEHISSPAQARLLFDRHGIQYAQVYPGDLNPEFE